MINYVNGDATRPVGEGRKILAHICNDVGGWGAGIVTAISKRWLGPEQDYRSQAELKLGECRIIKVEQDLYVANMIAQCGYRSARNPVAVRYDALELCLGIVANWARDMEASLHIPRIGCGLGGGSWDKVLPIVGETCVGLEVFVYDFG
jgi:O-acetyl-ADP-ribose deacetylase (regulator of RNase III)